MKNLYDTALADQTKQRIQSLRSDSPRRWGKMGVAQVVAHCSAGVEMALGEIRPARELVGRIIGPAIKHQVLKNDAPLRRNAPTSEELLVRDEPGLDAERARLCLLIDRFVSGGPAVCTPHPHPFFGPMRPEEWAILMYKHLDHHLRQFGA